MREDHGFRVTDYQVENDATPPRACFTLSDPLSRTVTDFSPYFKQDPGPVSAVTADGSKLCVEGLKHGGNYTITVRKGLPSAVDEDLPKDYDFTFYVRDRAAGVRFAGKAYVLPRTGQSGIPVLTVNTKGVKLALYRIGDRGLVNSVLDSNFLSQIDGYAANSIADEKGAKVWEGTLDTPSPLNEEVTTGFPVDAALGKLDPGLYVMTARAASQPEGETYENVATQWFVISDLGLTTMNGKDGMRAFVRSIASADPLKDVELRLVAHNNEILGTATTDDSGAALFAPGLVKGTGGLAPALLVASTKDGDYDFIDITQPAFDLTDRGVEGRDPPGAIDAFVYAERGVYRRGETVHSAVLLRDGKANAITGLPITLIVERPDGVEYSRTQLADQGAGGRAYDFTINAAAQGGTWSIKAYTDPKSDPVGQTSFLVEDYVPDRIEFDLKTQATVITTGNGAPFTVDGRYLFGAPGAGLDLEGDISVTANDTPFPQWKDYSFGLTDERVDTVQNTITPLPQTDINGHADLVVRLPELPSTTRPLKADISIRMREPGGRAVENDATLPVEATQAMFGIKTDFDADYAPQGQSSGFDIVALDPKGNPVAVKHAAWTLKKLSYDYQWFNVDGDWRYEEVTRSSKLAGGTLDLDGKTPAHLTRTLDWGLYRLEIGADGMTPASIDFSAGYYWSDTSKSDTPDTLSVALDKTTAATGDTLNVKIDSKNAGKASIQIVGDRLLAMQMVDVPAGGISVPVTIGKDWGAGAYAVATLYRPMDVKAKRMPARAIGVAWFGIDRAARTLDVKLSTTGVMKPRQNLDVPVKISNLPPGEEAYVTVAAVDVGILNLTRYKAPAPESYYYDQTRLTAEFRDLYGSLIDGMQGAAGAIRSGGDAGAAFTSPPPTQPPLALFSGLVKVKDDGTADVSFAIPGFNGTVRVMAVAWTASKVGHAQADVIVRDPIVVAGTLPRFMAAGDQSRLRLDIINTEAPAGDYSLGVTVDGPVTGDAAKLTQKVTIGAAGARVAAFVPITATAPGDSHITARLVGPDIVIEQDYTLHVVPANPLVTRRTTMDLAANGGSITLSPDLISEMVPGTSAVSLSVSTIPELDAAGLIRDLDRYPYGCSEQTVSRALPLLYLSDLKAGKDFADDELKRRLADSVARLLNRQSANGSFGLWSAGDGDANLWLSSFVTDFLLRAREKGFDVPENNLTDAINYLRNSVGNAPDIEDGKGEDMAYALYVLARAGRAPVGDLKYLADTKLESFGTVMGRAHIGAALAILGDRQRAETAFSSAADELGENEDNPSTEYREDYGSNLRDASALLALGIDGKASDKVIRVAAKAISTERTRSRYASTQEMSWMVLAARAIENDAKTIRLDVNGAPQQGALYKLFGEGDFTGNYRVANTGPSALRAVVAVSGSPKVADPAASNGLKVTRAYFTPDGKPVDPASVAQNTRLVAVITVDSAGNGSMDGRFLVSDRLPAGFEIENPSLVASGSTASLSWLETSGSPTYTEFRDDRFTAAFGSTPLKVAYMVRAVSPGTYAHPGVTVEDMYRPEINASTGTSTVVVTEP
ncbi:alpha-2-macroglobulin family protein [Aestuariivirga sp.]|uniref:alpha-2-macroglobulin family protein n=1 Tax=Aestuariivirga sp. TaxID=2650926 RepID=UPI0039E66D00